MKRKGRIISGEFDERWCLNWKRYKHQTDFKKMEWTKRFWIVIYAFFERKEQEVNHY